VTGEKRARGIAGVVASCTWRAAFQLVGAPEEDSMWLQAAFSREDVVLLAEQLFPIHLAVEDGDKDGRHVYLARPRILEMVVDKGLRVQMRARVRWPVLGIDVPIDVPNVTALFTVQMAQLDGEAVFSLVPEIEALDVTHIPDFVAHGLMGSINAAIAKDHAALTWRFTRTLDFRIPIPEADARARRLHLAAKWGDVRVTADGVTVVATLTAEVTPRGEADPNDPAIAWKPSAALEP
jgi:hypothetical protein